MLSLFRKKTREDWREQLAELVRDFLGSDDERRALGYFDDPDADRILDELDEEIYRYGETGEDPAYLIWPIFMGLLRKAGRVAGLDWGEGPEGCLDAFNALLTACGEDQIVGAERAALLASVAERARSNAKPSWTLDETDLRFHTELQLQSQWAMAAIARERGLVLMKDAGLEDGATFVLASPEAAKRWGSKSIGGHNMLLEVS